MLLPVERLTPEGVTRDHRWLTTPTEILGRYTSWDAYNTARLRIATENELRRAAQLEFFRDWFRVVPVAIKMQRRGFGEIDWAAHDALKAELEEEHREVGAKIAGSCRLLRELELEPERWRAEHEAKDRAAALAKNALKKRPLPEELVKLTKTAIRMKGYVSRVRKAAEARDMFLRFTKSDLLRKFIFEELGLKAAPKTRQRPTRSLSVEAVQYMLDRLPEKHRKHAWVLRGIVHLAGLNTVLQRYMHPPNRNGRLYPTIKLYSAETLRWALADPPLQQWPMRMRKIVRAKKGHVFVARDYSQIEGGIMPILAGDTDLIAAFLDPERDIHIENALIMFNLVLEKWNQLSEKAKKFLRTLAKRFVYELQYGGEGGKSLGDAGFEDDPELVEEFRKFGIVISKETLISAGARWKRAHPKIIRYREKLVEDYKQNGYWLSPFGYKSRTCEPISNPSAQRSLYNRPLQHGVAEIMRRAIIELDRLGCPLVLNFHDELVAEVPASEAEYWLGIMKEVMEQPIPEFGGTKFPTSGAQGETWASLK